MAKYIVNNGFIIDFDNHEIKNTRNGRGRKIRGFNEKLLKLLIENPERTIKYDNIINDLIPDTEVLDEKRKLYDAKEGIKKIINEIDNKCSIDEWIYNEPSEGYRFIGTAVMVKSDPTDISTDINLLMLYTLLYGNNSDKEILFSRLSTKANYEKDIPSYCFTQSCHEKLTMLEFLERVLPGEALSYIDSLNSKQRDQLSDGLIPTNIQQSIYSDIRYNELWLRELLKKCKRETENNLFNIEIGIGMSSLISIVNNDGRSRRLFDCYRRCTDGRFYYRGLAVLLVYSLIGRNRFTQLVSQDTDYRLFIE